MLIWLEAITSSGSTGGVLAAAPSYFAAVANTCETVGNIADLTLFLVAQTGARPVDFHLIGHGLGTHTAGFAGKRITGTQVGRITEKPMAVKTTVVLLTMDAVTSKTCWAKRLFKNIEYCTFSWTRIKTFHTLIYLVFQMISFVQVLPSTPCTQFSPMCSHTAIPPHPLRLDHQPITTQQYLHCVDKWCHFQLQ
jgi:hypothetical protein